MAQYEDLDIFGTIAPTAQHQQVEDEADKTIETSHSPILATSEPIRSTPTRNACSACPDRYSAPTGPAMNRTRSRRPSGTNDGTRTAIGYVRVSSAGQAESGAGLTDQRRVIRAECDR
jgi:hypothetical protein